MNRNFPALDIRLQLVGLSSDSEEIVLKILNKEFGDSILNCKIEKFHPTYNKSKGRRVLRNVLLKRDGDLCHWCKTPIDFNAQGSEPYSCSIEHLKRKCEGGSNFLDNLALAHKVCNNERHKGN